MGNIACCVDQSLANIVHTNTTQTECPIILGIDAPDLIRCKLVNNILL